MKQGWRAFKCPECPFGWAEPCRDHKSPSGEHCPCCNEPVFPYRSWADEALPIDKNGNLTTGKVE